MMKTIKFRKIFGIGTAFILLVATIFGSIPKTETKNPVVAEGPTVTCLGVANDENNNILDSENRYRTLLKYSDNLGDSANAANVASTTGQGIKLNGVKLSEIPDAVVDYAHGKTYLDIKIPKTYQDSLVGDLILEAIEGTAFESQILDGYTLGLKNDKWESVSSVNFDSIVWNDTGYNFYENKKGVLLGFTGNLSNKQSEKDGNIQSTNFASTVGEHIYLGGAKLSTLPGAMVSYHSMNMMFIYADGMSAFRCLKIDAGTLFLNSILPEVNLYYEKDSKWSTTQVVVPTSVSFSEITWNDTGYDFYENKKGVLIAFTSSLSTIQSEYDGGIRSINFASTIGEHVYLGGAKLSTLPGAMVSYHSMNLLFIYADNMSAYRTLKIDESTKILDAVLPELTLYYNASDKWGTAQKTEIKTVTFSGITWNDTGYNFYKDMKGVLLNFSDRLTAIQNEYDGNIQPVDFSKTVGEHIFLGGAKLSTLPGAFVSLHSTSLLFIYAQNMSSYRKLSIEGGVRILDAYLPSVNLYYAGSTKWGAEDTCEYKSVTYAGIQWNNVGYNEFEGKNGLLIQFSDNLSKIQFESDGGIRLLNFAKTSIGENIKLGGVSLKDIDGAEINYYALALLWIYTPEMTKSGKLTIESAHFIDVTLPELEFSFNGTKWINHGGPVTETAHCQGVANDENNNHLVGGYYTTLFKYDVDLGLEPSTTNVVSSTGQGIELNGVKLSEISNCRIDYANGTKFLGVKINPTYQDSLTGEIILEIKEGTIFQDYKLDSAKFVLKSGKWNVYKDAEPVTMTSILWNNFGSDVFTGKNGLLISYSDNLSNVSTEIKGSLRTTNLISDTIGGKIKLDNKSLKDIDSAEVSYFGSSFLWIYAPDLASYSELSIETNTFFTSILPETHLRNFNGEWSIDIQINNTVNGLNTIDNRKKNGKTIVNEEYFANLYSEKDLATKLVNFKANGASYGQNEYLEVNDNTAIEATVVGFETTKGASVRISTGSDLRFRSQIDKQDFDYLVTKYGASNVERGTYIVPESALGLDSLEKFVSDSSHEEGFDYLKIVNTSFLNSKTAESDGYYSYTGSISNILPGDAMEKYIGIGYIKVTESGKEYVVLAGNEFENHSRSTYDVIKSAYKDYEDGSKEKESLKAYLDGVVKLETTTNGIELVNEIDGYVSPYVVNCNGETGEYIVSGNSEIKSISLNNIKVDGSNIIKVGDDSLKMKDYVMETSENLSTVKFKLSSLPKASDLVDFTVDMPKDREMKILQITDTQIIDSSQMRNPGRLSPSAVEAYSRANIDKRCFNHVEALIENENPDLIIFTGDIVYGEFDDSGEIWELIVEFMDSFNIPWAPVFGNHDNETIKGVDWQCQVLESAKNCLFKKGDLSGNGNYSIGLVDPNGKIARILYMLDTQGCLANASVASDQIKWFKDTAKLIDETYGEKVPAFACYHIATKDFPIAVKETYGFNEGESFNLDKIGNKGDFGQLNEKSSICQVSIAEDFKQANVEGVFVGHDHVNNYSIFYDGIRYTYGTKTGTYDYYNGNIIGGTLIRVLGNGSFEVSHKYLNENEMNNRKSHSLTVTFMSDIHIDTNDYGGFYCTKSRAKLTNIVNETQGSRFYVNLGDTVNSDDASFYNYYNAMETMRELNLNVYNKEGNNYIQGNRMMYNLVGNHEIAYSTKDKFKDYAPYEEGIGSTAVFKEEGLMFVCVDALFTRGDNPSDDPADIISCTEFSIPEKEINWLKGEVASKMDDSVKGIVWVSHVALQDIDDSKTTLLNELKGYNLPMSVFEGHTHIEKYQELKDETGKVYCKVYTLPAVVLYDTYPYYNVTFKNGAVWNVDKHNSTLK